MIYLPPMAAVGIAGVQHRQRFDAWSAKRLPNRQRFAGAVPLGRDPRAAVADSVRTLGVPRIACLLGSAPLRKLASFVSALGPCAACPIGLP